ncbi:MAG: tol-pal system protein YbgF [Desulfuromonadaceae bacterium]|nr:tol-pal system protein YbgF [Desulfuromonadaceae bacterium]MDD5104888.1 tol-pal system protein YbgF [Desulfuromonadaceae bacterium]
MNAKYAHVMILLLLVNVAGCASQSSLDNVRNDVDSVKTRLFTIDRDLAAAREESKSRAAALETGVKGDVTAVRKMSADIQATIDSTKSDMQALNGKLDDATLAAKKPAEDLARYRDDADKRIFSLEERLLKQQAELDALSKTVTELAVGGKRDESIPDSSPDALYLKGLDSLKAGDVATARAQFTKFIEQNPTHELAANSLYWIGETYYSEKNFEAAILSYQDVIKKYPGKEKVIAAMLKQAMSFEAIKDVKSAKFVLKKLIEGFPKSEEAKKARVLLKEIK